MIYTRRNIAEEQEEACQKAKQLTDCLLYTSDAADE